MTAPGVAALATLEQAATRALDRGDERGLTVLGYGEISTVLALDEGNGRRFACKRLPPFDDEARWQRYRELFERYLAELTAHGIELVETELASLSREGGGRAAYVVQPLQDPESLLTRYLARCDDAEAETVFAAVLDRTLAFVSPARGFDAQLSNWVWRDGVPRYLDVTTPLLRDEAGRDLLDLDLFLASLPWALRGVVRRFMVKDILDKYHDPRGVVLDVLGNLFKERLEHHLLRFVAIASARFERPFTPREVWDYYADDAGTWALLLRVRRMDRWWQRRVRRRAYPFILPGPIERNTRRPGWV